MPLFTPGRITFLNILSFVVEDARLKRCTRTREAFTLLIGIRADWLIDLQSKMCSKIALSVREVHINQYFKGLLERQEKYRLNW
jgi:hypothetical protein